MNQHTPHGPEWEPEWMRALRALDQSITREVQRYIDARRRQLREMFLVICAAYVFAFAIIELLRWWLVG